MNTSIKNSFRALVNGTTGHQHPGVAGTNNDIRTTVWDSFRAAYPDTVTISINDVVLTLTANHSISGKSTSYHGAMTKEQYIAITGDAFGLKKVEMPSVSINIGRVQINGGGRHFVVIENSKVFVL